MLAYAFLRTGGIAPFTEVRCPRPQGDDPGEWFEVGRVGSRGGIGACAAEHLPYWFQDELWEIELDGDVQQIGHKLTARRARLVRRVEAWNPEVARSFSLACADRAAAIAEGAPQVADFAADAAAIAAGGRAAVTGYIVSRAAELAGGVEAYEEERATQAAWLADGLGL